MKLDGSQVAQFRERGYLLVQQALDGEDLQPVISEYSEIIERRARRLYEEGKVSSAYAEGPFERRLARLAEEAPEAAADLDIMRARGEATFRFLLNRKVLDLAECFVGTEIVCNPTQHLRAVLPLNRNTAGKPTPWHQDAGVLWPEADPYFILTMWIPLTDVSEQMGCLEVLPGSHRGGLCPHRMTP